MAKPKSKLKKLSDRAVVVKYDQPVQGEKGDPGRDGKDGYNGKDGRDGWNGINGLDGEDGKDGKDGKDGRDGRDGKDGIDGRDGTRGKDGKDAPQLQEILDALFQHETFKKAIDAHVQSETGKMLAGAVSGGGGGSNFVPADLPGYRQAGAGKFFGTNTSNQLGFHDWCDIDMAEYTRLIDTDGNYKYVGESDPGTATSAATWRIKRIEFIGGGTDDIEVKWADGVNTFTKEWDDRATYTYS